MGEYEYLPGREDGTRLVKHPGPGTGGHCWFIYESRIGSWFRRPWRFVTVGCGNGWAKTPEEAHRRAKRLYEIGPTFMEVCGG